MSQTDKLLQNIREYTGLLEFLNEKHPQVLKEWEGTSTCRTHQGNRNCSKNVASD